MGQDAEREEQEDPEQVLLRWFMLSRSNFTMNLMAGVNKVGMNDNDGIFMCVCMLFMEFYVHMYIHKYFDPV